MTAVLNPAAEQNTTDLERAVLGAAMKAASAYERCAAIIDTASFATPAHQTIWDTIAWVNSNTGDSTAGSVQADALLVSTRLQEVGLLETIGGLGYLAGLVRAVPTVANAPYYARKMQDAADNRLIAATGSRLAQGGMAALPTDEKVDLVAQSQAALDRVLAGTDKGPVSTVQDEIAEGIADLTREPEGVLTGLKDLDDQLVGLGPGQVCTIGARPATGKTLIGLQIASNVARAGRPAFFLTLEMSKKELLYRLMSNVAGVNTDHLNPSRPAVTPADWARLDEHFDKIADLPLHWADDAAITPARLSALIGQLKRSQPDLGIVVIDYLQLMEPDSPGRSRQEEVAAISRAVKLMAKRHRIPIVLLSQLNRKADERSDRRPQLSDIRESGAVEQDSDIVLLLHNPTGGQPEHVRAGELDILIEKNRAGSTGQVSVAVQWHYSRAGNLARRAEEQRAAEVAA